MKLMPYWFLIIFSLCFIFIWSLLPDARAFGELSTIKTTNFVMEFSPEIEKTASALAGKLDEWADDIIADTGIDIEDRFTVRLADTEREYKRMQPAGSRAPLWSTAVAYPNLGVMILKTPRLARVSRPEWGRIFRHECTHLLLGLSLSGREIPVWLNEGLAQYEARQGSLAMASIMAEGVLFNRLYTLSEIARSFPDDADDARLAYIQSFYFISYLRNKYGVAGLKQLIREIGGGEQWFTALRLATGKDLRTLESEWRRHLKWRFNWIPLITSTGTLWFVMSLIFVIVYIRKKSVAQKTLEVWEVEEAVEDAMEQKKDIDLLH